MIFLYFWNLSSTSKENTYTFCGTVENLPTKFYPKYTLLSDLLRQNLHDDQYVFNRYSDFNWTHIFLILFLRAPILWPKIATMICSTTSSSQRPTWRYWLLAVICLCIWICLICICILCIFICLLLHRGRLEGIVASNISLYLSQFFLSEGIKLVHFVSCICQLTSLDILLLQIVQGSRTKISLPIN